MEQKSPKPMKIMHLRISFTPDLPVGIRNSQDYASGKLEYKGTE